ncbi:MAG: TlpA family protein disulfide reductase [Chloroflexi bacterium]|nr:TlpA family protein disulfide reductase [Chloroflexota bacterium]
MTQLVETEVRTAPAIGASADAAQPRGAVRTWLPAVLAGSVVVGLLVLLWFGLGVRQRGTVGNASVPFRQAPDFSLGLFDGSTFRLSEARATGKPVLVNFWASWCVPCREEAPMLEAAWKRNRDRVMFVGVDVQDTEADALAFLREFKITYPNGAGNAGPISVTYGMRGVPESYFVTADGRVIRKWNGPLGTAGLEQFLAELFRANEAGA